MIEVQANVAEAEGARVETALGAAMAAALRDIRAPLGPAHADSFRPVGTRIVYSGPRWRLPVLVEFWRDLAAAPDVHINLLPSRLFTPAIHRSATAALLAVRFRRFTVRSTSGMGSPPGLLIQTGMNPGGSAIFGSTAHDAHGIYVAYSTHTERYSASRRMENEAVFRQAKIAETLVHELSVHGLAFAMGRRDHHDGWSLDDFRRDPAAVARYRSVEDPRLLGARALRYDCNPRHLRRGALLERDAYHGVTRPHGLETNLGLFAPSDVRDTQRADFVERLPSE